LAGGADVSVVDGPIRASVLAFWAFGIVSGSAASADVNRWSAIGPFGYAPIHHLAMDPNSPATVYAAADSKLFRTDNGGDDWSVILGPEPPNFNPTIFGAVVVAATSPSTVYVSQLGSLIRSVDGGLHWTYVGFGGALRVEAIAVDPLVPSVVYAGTTSGVYKTEDSGDNWLPVNAGLEGVVISLVVVDPITPSTVYAGSSGLISSSGTPRGLFKSSDGGLSWSPIDGGLKRSEDRLGILALAIDPISGTIYASKVSFFNCLRCTPVGSGGLFRSLDGGGTWQQIGSAGFSGSFNAIAVAPTSPPSVYLGTQGGVYVSSDMGKNWSVTTVGSSLTISSLAVDPTDSNTVYAGTGFDHSGGVLKTTNAGRDWRPVQRGIVTLNARSLIVAPTSPQILYAGTDAGLFRSDDAGGDWVPDYIFGGNIRALVLDPSSPSTLYAVGAGIFKHVDGGGWTPLISPDFLFSPSALAIDPKSSSTLYAGAFDLGGSLGPGILRSTDGGRTWQKTSFTLDISTIAIDPISTLTVYAAARLGGLYKSTDGGSNWKPAGVGIPPNINALAIDPVSPSILYSAADTGLFRSTDGGASWTAADNPELRELVYTVTIDPKYPSHVYAGTWRSGVFRSVDRGQSWGSIGGDHCVQSLGIDPSSGTLYAGTCDDGVASMTFLSRVTPPRPRTLQFR
jgi:photosystem II stability/assembly factor-like uncharacterized protein